MSASNVEAGVRIRSEAASFNRDTSVFPKFEKFVIHGIRRLEGSEAILLYETDEIGNGGRQHRNTILTVYVQDGNTLCIPAFSSGRELVSAIRQKINPDIPEEPAPSNVKGGADEWRIGFNELPGLKVLDNR